MNHELKIYFESRTCIKETYQVTDDEFEEIKRTGILPHSIYEELVDRVMRSCESDYDYMIKDEYGRIIADWDLGLR